MAASAIAIAVSTSWLEICLFCSDVTSTSAAATTMISLLLLLLNSL
jgi:hypothetical protein